MLGGKNGSFLFQCKTGKTSKQEDNNIEFDRKQSKETITVGLSMSCYFIA